PVGQCLANLRANFTPENILKASKAENTFRKHQSNNERFIQLDDIVADVDYFSVISKYGRYRQNGGKKSLEDRMRDYKISLLRAEVKEALGVPGTAPPQPTVNFDLLTQDINIFLTYIAEMRSENGGLLKPGTYASFRSSLSFLFFCYKYDISSRFDKELKNAMEGVKRYTNTAVQAGKGSIFDGNAVLPWALYEQFNKWFLAEDDEDGIFAACFSKLTCSLACRGSSTSQICTSTYSGSTTAWPSHLHMGKINRPKLPRHCYANPLNLAADLLSSLFHYFMMNPGIIANCEELLFCGLVKSQAQRFGEIVKRICRKYKNIIQGDFAVNIKDIGVHFWQKCAHTKLNTGSAAGPSGPAACLQGGHLMGKNRDVYIAHEKASDSYCGPILQGLPEHSPKFAVSYPDFVPLDLEQSLRDGIPETVLAERQ
ncbi:hypothetical protein ACHAXN_000178, partial [Cyclotella atomus]